MTAGIELEAGRVGCPARAGIANTRSRREHNTGLCIRRKKFVSACAVGITVTHFPDDTEKNHGHREERHDECFPINRVRTAGTSTPSIMHFRTLSSASAPTGRVAMLAWRGGRAGRGEQSW